MLATVVPPPRRLPILQPTEAPSTLQQDCSRCRAQHVCWKPELDDHAIVVNLLVCRIQRRVDANAATKTLLKMVRPKLLKSADKLARKLGGASVRDVVRDLESVAIESLLSTYIVGESLHPLRWLFGEPNGTIPRYCFKRAREHRMRAATECSLTTDDEVETHIARMPTGGEERRASSQGSVGQVYSLPHDLVVQPNEFVGEVRRSEQAARIRDVLEDGVTLNTLEYRVLSFCMHSVARGAQCFLQSQMGLSRHRVTRIYAVALRRVIQATGLSASYLQQRGLRPRRAASRRRRKVLQRRGNEAHGLSPQEVARICRYRKKRIPLLDIAWAYGVSEDTVRAVHRKYGRMNREEIESALVPTKHKKEPQGGSDDP